MNTTIHILYVAEKVQRGVERAEKEGVIEQEEVEKRFSKWASKQSDLRKQLKILSQSQNT
ncbi:MAG: hypothetical protein SCABRO_00995 [Candidatus Scalindua brodae]|uniref:Uncharacterized protein n=1 Tax=Candidatus Scalindua brodae TaxID=237368 RepID=A0A0B0EQ07_9BACT|nr:MAG: hypothetical protein SCABRO_00995 [Candidatus Scalindua brodae]